MYTYDECKQSLLDRFYHNQSLNYVRALIKFNKTNQNLDWHSKRDLSDCKQCTLVAYTAMTSVAILCAIPIYVYKKNNSIKSIRLGTSIKNKQQYNSLFYNKSIQQYSTSSPPLQSAQSHYKSEHRHKLFSNTILLLLCGIPILYSITGRRINDHCYTELLQYKTSDLARQCQKLYQHKQNTYHPQPLTNNTIVNNNSHDNTINQNNNELQYIDNFDKSVGTTHDSPRDEWK